jgi:hypothetical protein
MSLSQHKILEMVLEIVVCVWTMLYLRMAVHYIPGKGREDKMSRSPMPIIATIISDLLHSLPTWS